MKAQKNLEKRRGRATQKPHRCLWAQQMVLYCPKHSRKTREAMQRKMVQSFESRYLQGRLVGLRRVDSFLIAQIVWKQVGHSDLTHQGKNWQLNQKPLELHNEKKALYLRRETLKHNSRKREVQGRSQWLARRPRQKDSLGKLRWSRLQKRKKEKLRWLLLKESPWEIHIL